MKLARGPTSSGQIPVESGMNFVSVIAMIKKNVAAAGWLRMTTASQLLNFQFQIKAVSSEKLTVFLGQLVVRVGGGDLLVLDQVHHLQHLEANLVHQALGVLGQQHDLLEVEGVAQTSDWFSGLNAAVSDGQLAHLLHDSLPLQSVDVAAFFDAELLDPVVLGVAAL